MFDLKKEFPEILNNRVVATFGKFSNITLSGTGSLSAKILTLFDILKVYGDAKVILWVVNDDAYANGLGKHLAFFNYDQAFIYDVLNDENLKPRDVLVRKTEFIARMLGKKKQKVLITTYQNLFKDLPNIEEFRGGQYEVEEGEKISEVALVEALIDLGYELSDEKYLGKGAYMKTGGTITIFPINRDAPVRIEIGFGKVEAIYSVDLETGNRKKELKKLSIAPLLYDDEEGSDVTDLLSKNILVVEDELDIVDEYYNDWNRIVTKISELSPLIAVKTFNEDEPNHEHLHYLSVLKYRTLYDFVNDMIEKKRKEWNVLLFTKNKKEIETAFEDHRFPYIKGFKHSSLGGVSVVGIDKADTFPTPFQNPELKLAFITDNDVSIIKEDGKKASSKDVYTDFLTGLKTGDFVVHSDHGVARFLGLDKRTVDEISREYLKLGYAENDKLFVPIDQADKVNKYIGSEDLMPRLTRLGSAEWNTITSKVKKETQALAEELLKLYASRRTAKGFKFNKDNDVMEKFEETFPYEETPGQIKAINAVKKDMEDSVPMDRLVCGDVGFGKTEVAMRAAFKAVQDGKQVAIISPITILTDQHYRSFLKRMDQFHVRVEMLSRFRTPARQKEILKKMEKGEVDIVVGTHRLLQPDVKFKNLGLLVVDEEQRFGVQQKEKLKELRTEVDVLTLTATPIPRTLNICLNKLRDITTITTPPPGRLPVITEVRKYSTSLIREAILREINRGGQVYMLHNRVRTIDGFADKLRSLIPEARFGVAHGQLGTSDLEERILSFKEHQFDVLVSSTIIENGIDLANVNTLVVNNAEKFGLAQLYQLRGRVGRGKIQAYAYFLYHGQRLKLDAKKRLRAIVEASELGSGFQIAMKDLEIRGAGDVLGAKQHGVINVVGVSHFIRMLNKAVEELKAGIIQKGEEVRDVSIELPISAYIPDTYIINSKDKINEYQRLSTADTTEYLNELHEELIHDYGRMPVEVINLFKVLGMKMAAKKAGLINVKTETVGMGEKEIVLIMSDKVRPANIASLLQHRPDWQISGTRLRIGIKKLGMNWFDTLMEDIQKLTKTAKHV
ncbi:MAG: transcription-repair coupling factor [Patescibacteria group bacterium]|nr:transcription-repair coupling factor [Patescibacteria group bacterium]